MYDKRLSELKDKLQNNICCDIFLILETFSVRLNAKCDQFDEDREDKMLLTYGFHNVNFG